MTEYLSWDSDFFGWKTGILKANNSDTIQSELKQAKLSGYKLLYVVGDEKLDFDTATLEEYNGKLVDSKVVFKMPIHENASSPTAEVIEYNEQKVSEALYALAFISGEFSRFKTDICFKNNEFEKMYRTWIEQSVAKRNADYVFICRQKAETAAMVTLKIHDEQASIGLIATNTAYQGKGFGKKLIAKCIETAINNGCQSLTVPTQLNNETACGFYKSCGFSIQSISNIYHFWM